MKTPYKTTVTARDLPKEWQEAGAFAPDEAVLVTLEDAHEVALLAEEGRARLDALLREGLATPVEEVTEVYMAELEAEVMAGISEAATK